MEVYERLVTENDLDPPDLVISGESYLNKSQIPHSSEADTVVIFPPEKDTQDGGDAHGEVSEILEKPFSKQEQVRSSLGSTGSI